MQTFLRTHVRINIMPNANRRDRAKKFIGLQGPLIVRDLEQDEGQSVEHAGLWVLDRALHALQIGLEHLTGWSFQKSLCLVCVLLVHGLPGQEVGCFVGEHVAVVVDQVVLLRGVLVVHLFEVFLKKLLRNLRFPDDVLLYGLAIRRSLGRHAANATSKEVFSAVDDEGSVVDGVNLLSDEHHAHALGHSHGNIVDEEGDLFRHLKNNQRLVIQFVQLCSYTMKPGQSKTFQEAKKRNIEIINNLKQTLGKPTIVEAQRTLKILQKLIDRINIFLNLDSEFLLKFNEYSNSNNSRLRLNKTLIQELSPEVLDLVCREAKLEQEFKALAPIEGQLRENENVEEDKIAEFHRVRKDMEYTCRSLLRVLEKHPADIEILRSLKANSVTNHEAALVFQSLSNYKIIMQKMLATAAEEEESHAEMIKDLETKIESLDRTRANCDADLIRLRQERARHTEEKKEEIDKLKSQIREVRNYKENEVKKIGEQSKKLYEGLSKDHKSRQEKLKAEINAEKGKLEKLRLENGKSELKHKNQKKTNYDQLVDLINTYDKEMFTLTNSKTEAQKELKRVSDELNNLKRHFAEIEEERKREEAILEADRKRRERWELLEKRKGEAITRIKEAYRLWKAKNKKKKKKRR